jgi:tRNA(Ile)-lysidine synthase
MINKELIQKLKEGKNLLAFSAGVDSSALFFILLEENINFDIAIIDYGLREEAKKEISYAKELAKKYNKKIYTTQAPKFNSNFEANAREFRYNFFKEIIKKNSYTNLLTAHQLNDKLEWLLMRLSKGAGLSTLSGMQEFEQREDYNLIRPLLNYTKNELLEFLNINKHQYFIDKSNFNKKYERNKFRPIVDNLLQISDKKGFVTSFEILKEESNTLKNGIKLKFKKEKLRVISIKSTLYISLAVRFYLKELGYLISYKELQELLKCNSIVAGRTWAVEVVDNTIYIAPYIKTTLTKDKKEQYRTSKIPPKIRGYLFTKNINLPT